jgi:hypothetical protein
VLADQVSDAMGEVRRCQQTLRLCAEEARRLIREAIERAKIA